MLLAELAGVQQAGRVGDLDSVPVQGLVQLALSRLPLLQLVVLSPGSCEQIHSAVSQSVAADVGSKDALEGLAVPEVPRNEGLIPTSRVDQVLVLRILIELGAVDPVSVTVMRSVGLLELDHLLPLDLIVDPDHRLTSSSHQFGAVDGVIQTVELLVG
jgi:hypothetical protein